MNVNNTWLAVNHTWFGFLTGGSALHANHHADPANSSFSKKWYEIDPSIWFIRILEKK
jgi:fatty-acid desaturase